MKTKEQISDEYMEKMKYKCSNCGSDISNKIIVNLEAGEEILSRVIKKVGGASHIILPQKHIGKTATVIINKYIKTDELEKR